MLKGIPKNTEFLKLVLELVDLFKPDTYMELGTKRGYIFNAVSPKVKRAVAVDIAGFKYIDKHPNVEMHQKYTDALALEWISAIDFLFIDACHEKTHVLKDFVNFAPHVSDNGLILLHDTYPIHPNLLDSGYCYTAWEAAKAIKENPVFNKKYDSMTLPGPWFGLTVVRKIPAGREWGWML
jgi:hypothetical protein